MRETSESLISKEELEPDLKLRISDKRKRVDQGATAEGLRETSESLINKEELEPDPKLRINDERKRVDQGATTALSAGRLLVGVGAGAGIGALVGSIVPGPGTIIGAVVGATIGGFIRAKTARHKESDIVTVIRHSPHTDHPPMEVQYEDYVII